MDQLFDYRAQGPDGQEQRGQVQASDEAAALRLLVRQGLTPLHVQARAKAGVSGTARSSGRVDVSQQLVLLQELSTLLKAGISLAEALPSLAQAYANQPLGTALQEADRSVRGGGKLSDAMKQPKLGMPPYVLALVDAGEASGQVPQALADAAAQLSYDRQVSQEFRNALTYPAVLVSVGVLAVFFIFVWIVPRFAMLIRGAGDRVPAVSRALIEAGVYVQQHLWGFGLGAAALLAVLVVALSQAAVRRGLLEAAVRAPVVGPWLLRVDIGRWATVLGALLGNRVPIIQALELSMGALRLPRLREDLAVAAQALSRGQSLADALAPKGWIPPARLNLIRVGERSGELPRMLATLGEMETDAARTLQKRVLSLIEPAAILLIGAAIGFIMVAVMLAITSLSDIA